MKLAHLFPLLALCVVFGAGLGWLFYGLAPHSWGWLLLGYSIAVVMTVAVVSYGDKLR